MGGRHPLPQWLVVQLSELWGVRTMRILTNLLALIVLGLWGVILAEGQESGQAIERVGPGEVNWSEGWVVATGVGGVPAGSSNSGQAQAMAERAAYSVALRNLLETIQGVQVDSETTIKNFMIQDDVISIRVSGLVKGARILDTKREADGSVEMRVGLPLTGELSGAVIPKNFGRASPVALEDKPPTSPPPPSPAPPSVQTRPRTPHPQDIPQVRPKDPPLPTPSRVAPGSYTGLIVDARGLDLRPALVPRLLNVNGREEVYASNILYRKEAVQSGIVGYSKDLVAAARQARVTNVPLVVKGLGTSGTHKTDILLSESDVERIRTAESQSHFLQQARVVVVYD